MKDIPNYAHYPGKQGIMPKVKKMIFWYITEQSILSLPVAFTNILLWNIVARIVKVGKKDNKKIGFTGLHYHGNAKAVFNWMRKNTEYDCFWIARNLKSFLDVKNENGNAIYAYSLDGLIFMSDIDILVTSDSPLSILFQHRKPKVVQLWHGVGFKGRTSFVKGVDIWCESSDYTKKRRVEIYNIPKDKIYVTGLPRTDILFNYLNDSSSKKKICNQLNVPHDKKIILYAPTWEVGLFPFGNNEYRKFEKLCKFCESRNIVLILRQHPYIKVGKRKIKKIIKKYKMIYSFDVKKQPSVMELLAITDILITDLSSIATDFFLTKKPIIFMDVYRDYFRSTGAGKFIPLKYRAGEIINTEDELYNAIDITLKEGNRFEKEQKKALEIIHGNVDGKASERVAKVVEKTMREN